MFTYTILARLELHSLKVWESNRKYNYLNLPRHGHYTSTLLTPAPKHCSMVSKAAAFQPGKPHTRCWEPALDSPSGLANQDLPPVSCRPRVSCPGYTCRVSPTKRGCKEHDNKSSGEEWRSWSSTAPSSGLAQVFNKRNFRNRAPPICNSPVKDSNTHNNTQYPRRHPVKFFPSTG